MAQVISDRRDVDFVLFEQLGAKALFDLEKYSDLNEKTVKMIIDEARELGIKEIMPTYMEGDKQGVTFENGEVKVPECFHKAFELYRDGEWVNLLGDPEEGGQGLPNIFAQAVHEYLAGANFNLVVYAGFGHSVGCMVEEFGNDHLKTLFLKKLKSAEWGGSMLLTEPDSGSDLGRITTTAVENPDGTYSLSGGKIFITVGEHNLSDNIIHPVLARIQGAPEGTKGISIFLVPKYWVNEDGTIGDRNDIHCTGLEEKMGLHGMATCTMTLGTKNQCKGWLMGEPNQGMKIMFSMMNEARLGVGSQAFWLASNAYLHALNYARERIQGKDLTQAMNPDAPSIPICDHPDIRRMLLDMKALVDGMRSLVYYTALHFDLEQSAETDEEKKRHQSIIDLITPIVKAYCSDTGFDICVTAIQVFGGYGYTKEYPVEMLARDCKITSIYEGTNGIQSIDLLARKLTAGKGASFKNLMADIGQTLAKAMEIDATKAMAAPLSQTADKLGKAVGQLIQTMMSPQIKTAFAFSYPLLMAMGDLIMAWMLLWRAVTASEKLSGKPKKKDLAFYEGQIQTAEHFIFTKLPITNGKIDAITAGNDACIRISDTSLGK